MRVPARYKRMSSEQLIDQAKEYLASVRQHARCAPESRVGRGPGCTRYHNHPHPHPRSSCAEDLAFLYQELGLVYGVLAERE